MRILAKLCQNDLRTVYGKNMQNISQGCNTTQEFLSPSLVKHEMRYFSPPENEFWRSEVVQELLLAKKNSIELNQFDMNEISEMLGYLCSD